MAFGLDSARSISQLVIVFFGSGHHWYAILRIVERSQTLVCLLGVDTFIEEYCTFPGSTVTPKYHNKGRIWVGTTHSTRIQ